MSGAGLLLLLLSCRSPRPALRLVYNVHQASSASPSTSAASANPPRPQVEETVFCRMTDMQLAVYLKIASNALDRTSGDGKAQALAAPFPHHPPGAG